MGLLSFLRKRPSSEPPKVDELKDQFAYKRMFEPEPWFFAVLLLGVFWDPRLTFEDEDFDKLLIGLPEPLQPRGKSWAKIYLAWILYLIIGDKYGLQFRDDALAYLKDFNDRAENKIVGADEIAAVCHYWFPLLNAALLGNDYPEELNTAPKQWVAAYAFLHLGSDGPIFVVPEAEPTYAVLGNILLDVTKLMADKYKYIVELGAPLEEIT
jgi:hypothetical protein